MAQSAHGSTPWWRNQFTGALTRGAMGLPEHLPVAQWANCSSTHPRRDGLAGARVNGVESDLSLELGEAVALLVDALSPLLATVLHVFDLLLERLALVGVLTSQLVQVRCKHHASRYLEP